MIDKFLDNIPWWVKIPTFFVLIFVGSVFWSEDRDATKLQAAINPVVKTFNAQIETVSKVHDSDIHGLQSEIGSLKEQNTMLINKVDYIIKLMIEERRAR